MERVEKLCLVCNSAYKGIKRQRFCSDSCRHNHHRTQSKATERTFICIYCSTPFTAIHARKYCTPLCSSRASNRKKHTGPHTKECQVCNKSFIAKGRDKKNCSVECYKQAEKARYVRTRYHINISSVERVNKVKVFEDYYAEGATAR